MSARAAHSGRALTRAIRRLQIDVTRQVESGGPDVYAGLNLLVRRKPKENNFKAILDCIRDLMSEDTAVPEWLHDIFLGYGDPAAAQYRNMPDAVPTLDFKARARRVSHPAQLRANAR
jgi:intron-binding protein aquarius